MKFLVPFLLLAICFNIIAGSDYEEKSSFPNFKPSDGKALIVVVRDDGKGPKTSDEVVLYLDNKFINASYERTVTSFEIDPKKQNLCGLYDNDEDVASVLPKNFEANRIYYVHVNVYSTFNAWSGIQGGVEMTFVSKEKAEKLINEREDPLKYVVNIETDDDLDEDDYEDVMDEYKDYISEEDNSTKVKETNDYRGYAVN